MLAASGCLELPPKKDESTGGAAGAGGVAQGGSATGGEIEAGGASGAAVVGTVATVVFSEIMYHPVLEDDSVDNHEFIELANVTDQPLAVGGFTLEGGVEFRVPRGTTIPANGYLVIAKNYRRLLDDVPAYELDPDAVVGDYTGELSNKGETIVLLDGDGEELDRVAYGDSFPWPIAADAFGASEQFFGEDDARRPFTEHRFRGHSLERVNLALPSAELANWAASGVRGATPGRPNRAAAAVPDAVIEQLTARPTGELAGPILADTEVTVQATFSELGSVEAPVLEWFVEYRAGELTGDEPSELALRATRSGYTAELPAQPSNSVVRYRVLDGAGNQMSPRPTDPNRWHAYAVASEVPGETPPLHLFLAPDAWSSLFENIQIGRANSCTVNARWDERVPAVLVFDGEVYDVRVRYQGSPYNRWVGPTFSPERPFEGVGPARGPYPMRALSWSVVLPRYRAFPDGRRHLHFNKLTQACPGGLATAVVAQLFADANVPALQVRGFYRLHINGGYYHYVMDREHVDEDMLERVQPKGTPIGDLFKVVGYHKDQSVWGVGDARLLSPACGFSEDQRYAATYERQAPDWKTGSDEVRDLLERLGRARNADLASGEPGHPALRSFFEDNFDVDALLTYRAVFNWANVWDDYWQNHFYYRRADGKWTLIPYDFDKLMAGSPYGSFYIGEQNDPSARQCCDTQQNLSWWNLLADSLIKAYRSELNAKLHELNSSVLAPANVGLVVDRVMQSSGYNQAEARLAPAGTGCGSDYVSTGRDLKNFASARSASLQGQIPKP